MKSLDDASRVSRLGECWGCAGFHAFKAHWRATAATLAAASTLCRKFREIAENFGHFSQTVASTSLGDHGTGMAKARGHALVSGFRRRFDSCS